MTKTLLLTLFLILSLSSRGQFMTITSTQVTAVDGGLNVNLQTAIGQGAGFMSDSYTITGNVIDLTVCFWFNMTLPVLYFNHDFLIPVAPVGEYTINIHIMMSQSTEVCDNFSNPANATVQFSFMSNEKFVDEDAVLLYPNPSTGLLYLNGVDATVNALEVFDVSGKSVRSENKFTSNSLDLSGLQEGIYFIKLQTDQGLLNKKIVIRK